MRILLIEDDTSLSELVSFGLESEGFLVDLCHNGSDGLLLAEQNIYDLILLDRMLPNITGDTILKNIRKKSIFTPVIFITAIGDSIEKINGLDIGADDYLVKPFDIGELLARIRSVMRRVHHNESVHVLKFGDLSFFVNESKLVHNLSSFILTKKESELLAYFFKYPERLLTRQNIIHNVWGLDTEIEDGNLDNFIYLLRKKFKLIQTNVQITTIHRQGYSLTKE